MEIVFDKKDILKILLNHVKSNYHVDYEKLKTTTEVTYDDKYKIIINDIDGKEGGDTID